MIKWLQLDIRGGQITIEPRPDHCNRGTVIAKVFPTDHRLSISEADVWPRYYFRPSVAVAECEAWAFAHGAMEQQHSWRLHDLQGNVCYAGGECAQCMAANADVQIRAIERMQIGGLDAFNAAVVVGNDELLRAWLLGQEHK